MSEDAAEKRKIIIDEDWKSQVEEERSRLKQESAEPSDQTTESEEAPGLPPPSFPWLVTTLATQAMVALGQIPDPLEQKPVVNLELARHHIDMLAMLEQKTRGNLDREEAEMLEALQHQLRMAFVAMQNRPHGGEQPSAEDASK